MYLLLSIFLVLGVFASAAIAYPPAPGVVVYGLVRGPQAQTIGGASAHVVFKSGGVEIARAQLSINVVSGVNYRALLPIDMTGSLDGYKEGVLDAALPFTVEVTVAGQTFDPIEATAGLSAPSEPGTAIRFDFSLGTDSDGDGIPDGWEYWQLQAAGVLPGSDEYSLDQFSADGDYDEDGLSDREEYLAGTFAYLGIEALRFAPKRMTPGGAMQVEILLVAGRGYIFQGSTDLANWSPVSVRFVGENERFSRHDASNTAIATIEIPEDEVGRFTFYRMQIE